METEGITWVISEQLYRWVWINLRAEQRRLLSFAVMRFALLGEACRDERVNEKKVYVSLHARGLVEPGEAGNTIYPTDVGMLVVQAGVRWEHDAKEWMK